MKFRPRSAIQLLVVIVAIIPASGEATVILDGSLQPAEPRFGPNFAIPPGLGRLVGTNLFHSFSQFDIEEGQSVTFSTTGVKVTNIVARITGGPAHIDGKVSTDAPGPNLILVDSSGIIFGPRAQINTHGGSFVASTASYVRLADGGKFSAVLGTGDSTLTAASPSAFGFLAGQPAKPPAAIAFTGDPSAQPQGLAVGAARSLSIIGGDVHIVHGILTGGQVNLVSVQSDGEVALDPANPTSVPDVSLIKSLGTVELLQNSSVSALETGRVNIRAGRLTVDTSQIHADTSDSTPGGNIDIAVSGALDINNGRLTAETSATGVGGAIDVKADSIALTGLSSDGKSSISVDSLGTGNGGNISIATGTFNISQNADVTAFTQLTGNGGNINVSASRGVILDGTGSSTVIGFAAETLDFFQGAGHGGNITIATPNLSLFHEAEITSTTKGAGDAGNINLELGKTGTLFIDGGNAPTLTGVQARVGLGFGDLGAIGHGGQITVDAGTIELQSGGVITATTFGPGTGGNVVVDARRIDAVGSPASQFTGFFARAMPDVPIEKKKGAGGSIDITATNIHFKGNAAISAVSSTGGGNAGSVSINTQSLSLDSGASVTVQADPGIEGGNISVHAARDINLFRSTISANAAGNGRISLTIGDHLYLRASTITAQGTGNGGGHIFIDPPAVILDHSLINGLSSGAPVKVKIGQDASLVTSESRILSAALSIPPEVDVAGSLIHLPSATIAGSAQLEPQCGVKFFNQDISSFLVAGRGGEPPKPGGWFPELSLQRSTPAPSKTPFDK